MDIRRIVNPATPSDASGSGCRHTLGRIRMEKDTFNVEFPDTVFLFGAFELLVRRQLLVSAGTPVKVGTRAIAILIQLVKRAGELVSNEELVAAAWPSTFVHRANLKVNVANLRRLAALQTLQNAGQPTRVGRRSRLYRSRRANAWQQSGGR